MATLRAVLPMMTIIRLVQSTARIAQRRSLSSGSTVGATSCTGRIFRFATGSTRNTTPQGLVRTMCFASQPCRAVLHYAFARMGRPRSEEARQAALAATVDLVLAHGVEGVTFEDVAARSGVAKTTLYRHF